MMKLECEVKGDKFIYSYSVGSSRCSGDMPFNEEALVLFTALLKHLSSETMSRKSRSNEAFRAWAFVNAYPELIEEISNSINGKRITSEPTTQAK